MKHSYLHGKQGVWWQIKHKACDCVLQMCFHMSARAHQRRSHRSNLSVSTHTSKRHSPTTEPLMCRGTLPTFVFNDISLSLQPKFHNITVKCLLLIVAFYVLPEGRKYVSRVDVFSKFYCVFVFFFNRSWIRRGEMTDRLLQPLFECTAHMNASHKQCSVKSKY